MYASESGNNPIRIGSLVIVDNADGVLDYAGLCDVVEQRLPMIPRYRSTIREVPFGLGRPVWVRDDDFDIACHVRRRVLPEPGSDAQLRELVGWLAAHRLDHHHPLWEIHLIEGLSDGRAAVFATSHVALIEGEEALELGHVILDATHTPRPVARMPWLPDPEPSDIELAVDALADLFAHPQEVGVDVANQVFAEWADRLGAFAAAIGRAAAGNVAPSTLLDRPTSPGRLFTTASTDLAHYRKIRAGFDCTITDVILAVVTSALRSWLYSRGALLSERTMVRACVPKGDRTESAGDQPVLIDLPVGEPNPVMRLTHIMHAHESHVSDETAPSRTVVHLAAGFAPASLHAISVRAASTFAPHAFNLMVTNAPGPQLPMYVGGARMLEMYPVAPLLPHQVLSIGVTSYDGKVCYGLTADRVAMEDVDVLTGLLGEAMEEMLNACP